MLWQHLDLLRDAFRSVRTERPFTIDAIVILPEHLHTIWTLPEGDADYSGRWRAIKSRFTHALHTTGVSLTRDNRGEYRLWQRRFWEHTIRDERDYAHHIALMHGAITKPSFSAQRVMPSGINSDRLSFPLVVMPVPVRAAWASLCFLYLCYSQVNFWRKRMPKFYRSRGIYDSIRTIRATHCRIR